MFRNRAISNRRGFTIVEMMVGLTLLGVFMSGVIGSVRMSSLLAETTIYESTAANVAQGHLEQIKSLPYEDVLLAVQDPSNYYLNTLSPSYDSSQQVTVFDDPLSLESSKQPIVRNIMIDVRGEANDAIVEMPVKLWITIEDQNTGTKPVNALEIKLRYAYQLPQMLGGNWIEDQVQAIRARM